ncbi:MAG TPA: histidine phosphatase family protein [Limnochordia bacterium]|nr:histidine phosphatase family protein [Limnochordia bacterium]
MNEKTIIFIRHGETLWNKERRYQGQLDSPLSAQGLLQAEQVGEFLRKRPIDVVYSSDLKRALLTAESIAKHHQLSPLADQRLREMSFGVWEGLTRKEAKAKYPDLWIARGDDHLNTRIPQGELPHEVIQRLRSFLAECTSKAEHQTIVVVSHGGTLRFTLAELMSMPLEQSSCLKQSNTGLSELIFTEHQQNCRWEVVCLNSTGHLR